MLQRIFLCVLLSTFTTQAFAEEISDPLEDINRAIFEFNDTMDVYVLEPVARAYDWLLPDFVQEGVTNFFDNLNYPRYLVSDLVQLKFGQALHHTGRFALNTTFGAAGLFDIAKGVGLEDHVEDFGTALGYHGVGPGPYLVLPFLGPSNLRDGFGRLVDAFLNPTYYMHSYGLHANEADIAIYSSTALDFINQRANLFETVETAKESSLDYYLFVQSAYYQYRKGKIYDGAPPDEDPFADEFEDDFDDEFDDEVEGDS